MTTTPLRRAPNTKDSQQINIDSPSLATVPERAVDHNRLHAHHAILFRLLLSRLVLNVEDFNAAA